MARCGEDIGEAARLDDLARIHDRNPIGQVGHDAQVMGDQQHRHATRAGQLAHQIEHLALHGHVQRRRGLIRDQQLRFARQRHRDHDPLSHAAGKLVRERIDALVGVGYADLGEQLDHTLTGFALRHAQVDPQRFGNLAADRVGRVQRR